jgi:hypothetical protein
VKCGPALVLLVTGLTSLLAGTVTCADAAYLQVSGGRGAPGDLVHVSVSLVSEGDEISGLSMDLGLGPLLGVIPTATGLPSCRLQPAIHKELTGFAYLPSGCVGRNDCTGVRAGILGLFNTDPLPDGRIFTCDVRIAEDADGGTYDLAVLDATVLDPSGTETSVTARSIGGVVEVLALPPCPSDCDRDHEVSIDEVVTAIAVANGEESLASCPRADDDGDGSVDPAEVVRGALAALHGCPGGSATTSAAR